MSDALSAMPSNYSLQAQLFLSLLRMGARKERSPLRLCIQRAVATGLGVDAKWHLDETTLVERYVRGLGRLDTALKKAPFLLEHFVQNEILLEGFPFAGETPMSSYLQLVSRFGVVRLMLAARCNEEPIPELSELIATIRYFCRRFAHHANCASAVNAALADTSDTTIEGSPDFFDGSAPTKPQPHRARECCARRCNEGCVQTRPIYGALCVVALLLLPERARAADATLQYRIANNLSDCPDEEQLRGAVSARLGYDPFHQEGTRDVAISLTRKGKAIEGRFELRDERGRESAKRTLTAKRCDELVAALALAISIAIDPDRALLPHREHAIQSEPSLPTLAPKSEAPDARQLPAAPLNLALPPPRRPLLSRVHLALGTAGLGQVGNVAAFIGAGASLRYGAFGTELEARFLPPSSEKVGAGRVRTSTMAVAILPCAHFDPVFLCGNFSIGALQGEAEGIEAPDKATTAFAQGGIRVGAAITFAKRLSLEPFVDGLVTLTRTRITFRGQEVWATGIFGIEGGLRLALHIL